MPLLPAAMADTGAMPSGTAAEWAHRFFSNRPLQRLTSPPPIRGLPDDPLRSGALSAGPASPMPSDPRPPSPSPLPPTSRRCKPRTSWLSYMLTWPPPSRRLPEDPLRSVTLTLGPAFALVVLTGTRLHARPDGAAYDSLFLVSPSALPCLIRRVADRFGCATTLPQVARVVGCQLGATPACADDGMMRLTQGSVNGGVIQGTDHRQHEGATTAAPMDTYSVRA